MRKRHTGRPQTIECTSRVPLILDGGSEEEREFNQQNREINPFGFVCEYALGGEFRPHFLLISLLPHLTWKIVLVDG